MMCTAEDLIIYKTFSMRTKDRADVESIVQKQGDTLDDTYIENWLVQFEQALSDSTLVCDFRKIRTR